MSARLLVRVTRHPATSAPFRVGQSPIRQVMDSLCLSAVGIRFLAVLSHWSLSAPCGAPTAHGRPHWGFHVPHRQDASGELASLRRERGTVSTGPLTPVNHGSNQDVSTTFWCIRESSIRI